MKKPLKVLVVGGAGYVGSATCAWLLDRGHEVWVLDDLSTGHRQLVLSERFIQARLGDREKVSEFLRRERFDGVMHFAARSLVEESVRMPELYFENNVAQTKVLLEAMLDAGVHRFIFSSTAAVYGDPAGNAMTEDLPKKPLNPYGESKLQVERMLEKYARRGLQSIALRYFNAAGAESKLRVGEWHEPESHLIPKLLRASVENGHADIYGTDYATPDGTCVRDYIHVSDLAAAHEAAMIRLITQSAGGFEAFNLGSERGFSVREVISTCMKVTGKTLKVNEKPRRAGDPPRLVADSTRAKKVLGFSPEEGLESIIGSAWLWEQKRRSVKARKAVFLDRDGTINEDPGYIGDPDKLKLLPGVGESLAELKKAGYVLVIVSNQSGVGRGLFSESALQSVHRRLDEYLAAHGVSFDGYELCLHRPEDLCDCRKPKPKLILDAARKHGIDVKSSFMVGDKISDLEAGRAAGCRGVALVRTGEGRVAETKIAAGAADFIGDSLPAVARWILSQ